MPLHVVAGFLESVRGRNDSGVCGMNGIVCFQICLDFDIQLRRESRTKGIICIKYEKIKEAKSIARKSKRCRKRTGVTVIIISDS